MNWNDLDYDTQPLPPAFPGKHTTFVAADPAPIIPRRVEILPPAELPAMPQTQPLSRAQTLTTGSHTDRAHAFSHVTGRLALALGGLAVIVGVVGFGVPVVSLAVLAWFGTAYAVVWVVAYAFHVLVTAEGAAWLHVVWAWIWLTREQQHRHKIEWRERFPGDRK